MCAEFKCLPLDVSTNRVTLINACGAIRGECS